MSSQVQVCVSGLPLQLYCTISSANIGQHGHLHNAMANQHSEKAKLQWDVENRFNQFESHYQ